MRPYRQAFLRDPFCGKQPMRNSLTILMIPWTDPKTRITQLYLAGEGPYGAYKALKGLIKPLSAL